MAPRTHKRKEIRRKEILVAASKVFAKRGYHATSIDDICARAKIARGTFYLYFESKRDIFDTLIKEFTGNMKSLISIFSPDLSPLEQFNQNIRNIIRYILKNKHLVKIMVSEAVGLDSKFNHQLVLFYTELTEYLEGALLFLKKNGLLPQETNERVLAFSILGFIKEVMYHWALDKGKVLEMDPLLKYLKNFDLIKYITFINKGEKKDD